MSIPTAKIYNFFLGFVAGALVFIIPYKGTYYFLQYKVYERLYESETFLTVISGVLVFVFCQFIKEFYFDRIHEYKILIGQISSRLMFYIKVYSELQLIKPASEYRDELKSINEAKTIIRDLACNLSATYEGLPNKSQLAFLGIVRGEDDILEAVNKMLTLSQLECYPSANAAVNAGVPLAEIKRKNWNESRYDQNITLLNKICSLLGFHEISFDEFDITNPFESI